MYDYFQNTNNKLFCIMKEQMLFSRHALAMHDVLHLVIK